MEMLTIKLFNKHLKQVIPDDGIDGKIFRLSIGTKAVIHPDGWFMMPDRFHLQKKDRRRVTSPVMLTNWNVIFNLLCNKFKKKKLCCQ